MKFIGLFSIITALMINTSAFAEINNGALIMSDQSNKAFFYDGSNITGLSLITDNISGCPYVDTNSNVFVSVSSLYKSLGDSNGYSVKDDMLEIKMNGKKCSVPIGKKFVVRGNESNWYFVYKIGEDYYIPAKLAALVCGGNITYNDKTGDIVFFTDKNFNNNVVDENGALTKEFKIKVAPYQFMNNLKANNLYLSSDGKINSVENADCVFRIGETVYYTENYVLYLSELNQKPVKMEFYDATRTKKEISVYKAVNIGNRIYGISTGNAFGRAGRVFTCDNKGNDFRYIGNATAENLIYVNQGNNDYIYYMMTGKSPKLYMYDVAADDEYELIVIGNNNESLLDDMSSFSITDNGIVICNKNKTDITFITFERPAYECEWIKIRNEKLINKITSYGTDKFTEITSMNYDSIENILYVVDKKNDGYCLVKIDLNRHISNLIKSYDCDVENVCLFDTLDGVKIALITSDGIDTIN